jgi:hypothetical protein
MPLLLLCFFLGIVNFATHRAVIESGHPFVEDTKLYFGRHFGRYGSYMLEFVILNAALYFANAESLISVFFYFGYTALNILAAWLLLGGRV